MNTQSCVFIVDDDYAVRDSLGLVLETAGFSYQTFESAEQFLEIYSSETPGCLLLDMNMPGLNGDELQAELIRRNIHLPIIFLTAYGNIAMSVRAIKAGADDFLTKPVSNKLLIERIQAALQHEGLIQQQNTEKKALLARLSCLTCRELEVLPHIVSGLSNKEIARQLDISHRTVEIHRAQILKKTAAANLMELVRLYEACQLQPETKPRKPIR
ncbi:MAG: response regulator [Methylococcales bacterium]|nr:response regulator [Methylococcales bacterium]